MPPALHVGSGGVSMKRVVVVEHKLGVRAHGVNRGDRLRARALIVDDRRHKVGGQRDRRPVVEDVVGAGTADREAEIERDLVCGLHGHVTAEGNVLTHDVVAAVDLGAAARIEDRQDRVRSDDAGAGLDRRPEHGDAVLARDELVPLHAADALRPAAVADRGGSRTGPCRMIPRC